MSTTLVFVLWVSEFCFDDGITGIYTSKEKAREAYRAIWTTIPHTDEEVDAHITVVNLDYVPGSGASVRGDATGP